MNTFKVNDPGNGVFTRIVILLLLSLLHYKSNKKFLFNSLLFIHLMTSASSMFLLKSNFFLYCVCIAGSGPPSPNRESPKLPPVRKTKSETKKKWLKLTRKGLLLSSICKVGKKRLQSTIYHSLQSIFL